MVLDSSFSYSKAYNRFFLLSMLFFASIDCHQTSIVQFPKTWYSTTLACMLHNCGQLKNTCDQKQLEEIAAVIEQCLGRLIFSIYSVKKNEGHQIDSEDIAYLMEMIGDNDHLLAQLLATLADGNPAEDIAACFVHYIKRLSLLIADVQLKSPANINGE